jgi:hypothetical protein
MDRRAFLRGSTLISLSGGGLNAAWTTKSQGDFPNADWDTVTPRKDAVDGKGAAEKLTRVREAALAVQRKDWEHGMLAQALLEANDMRRVILLTKAAVVLKEPDGRLAVVGDGSPTDPAMAGKPIGARAKSLETPFYKRQPKDCCSGCLIEPRGHRMVLSITSSIGLTFGPMALTAHHPSLLQRATMTMQFVRSTVSSGGFRMPRKSCWHIYLPIAKKVARKVTAIRSSSAPATAGRRRVSLE